MKLFRQILFLLAASISLLHGLIPHDNFETGEDYLQECQEAHNVIDYLQLGLYINQGSGHLEHLSVAQKVAKSDCTVSFASQSIETISIFTFEVMNFPKVQNQTHFTNQNDLLPSSLRVRSNLLRGPPISVIN